MTVVYGIPNCDTVRKARAWLDAHGVDYRFHDFSREGVSAEQLAAWCRTFGWERVLNRAGTTFRKLEAAQREGLDEAKAITLMLAQPSMIRRPVLETRDQSRIGFDAAAWQAAVAGPI